MKRTELNSLSTEELFRLHDEVTTTLNAKLIAKKRVLENCLRELSPQFEAEPLREKSGRRPYPRVFPKFRNPHEPSETWTGRGKRPRWLTAQLRSGKRIEDFRIEHAA